MNGKGRCGAWYLARQSGQIQPPDGRRRLTDGTVITGTKIDPKRKQALVEGLTKNGASFVIGVPLSAIA